ncbi:unnamed protein product [Gordionus sp. m RMFG-2023]
MIAILESTPASFLILLMIAASLERYTMISCFHWHKKYCVMSNLKYLDISLIAILTIITFPSYHNYFRVSFDLLKYKVNLTNKRDMNVMVFTCLNLDGSEGYIL